jgi:ABC-2 type transport system ATP-binding protein
MVVGTTGNAITAERLVKCYGTKRALDGLDLAVPSGAVYGLLGPNGAGKTTAVRILTTLLRMDDGRAEVGGVDVTREPRWVRQRIGLTGQEAAVDEILSGRQNLRMFGRLFHLPKADAWRRADELLERFGLGEAADEQVRGYSGGMRRRLDLAASMILAPEVLFLDEPTTGLDPRGRSEVWESVRRLSDGGTTILLTTHYLDEADQLSDRIAVIDRGRNLTEDTPAGLKRTVGGDHVEIVVRAEVDLAEAAALVGRIADGHEPQVDAKALRVQAPVADGVGALGEVVRGIEQVGIGVEDVGLRRPTLDEVFLQLTGRPVEVEEEGVPA